MLSSRHRSAKEVHKVADRVRRNSCCSARARSCRQKTMYCCRGRAIEELLLLGVFVRAVWDSSTFILRYLSDLLAGKQ
jgi:hypothetical protein